MPETVHTTQSARTSYVRWLLVLWLFVLSAVAYLDRVNISIAGGQIAQEYGINNVGLGLVFSSFLWGYGLFQTLAGWLADRFGPRRMLTAGVLWWGLVSVLTAAVPRSIGHSPAPLIVLTLPVLVFVAIRFLLGAGEAIMYPSSNQFVARWIPSHERGAANGVIFAGVGIGAGVTPPLISWFMLHYGWRSSFVLSAIIGLAAGVVWYLAARDNPESHPSVSPRELSAIQNGIPKSAAANAPRLAWLDILASGNVWILSFAYFCFGYVAWVYFSWFYLYLAKVRGLDLKSSAHYATLPFLAMAVCSPLGGVVSDALSKRFGSRVGRCSVAALGFGLSAIFLVFGSAAHDSRLASAVLAGGAGSLYLSQSAFWAVSADIGGKSAGGLSGFMNMANQIGGALTAIATPWFGDMFGWSTSFRVAATVAALGAVAWLFVNPRANLSPSMTIGVAPQTLSGQKETA